MVFENHFFFYIVSVVPQHWLILFHNYNLTSQLIKRLVDVTRWYDGVRKLVQVVTYTDYNAGD